MTERLRRNSVLVSTGLILLALTVGIASYRGLSSDPAGAGSPTTTSVATTTSTMRPPDVDELAVYIDDHFSEADWYESITGYEFLDARGVVVLTSLDEADATPAVGICRAVSFWRPGDDLQIIVRNAKGDPLAETFRGERAEECKAVPGEG